MLPGVTSGLPPDAFPEASGVFAPTAVAVSVQW
jgi:hypothetical protein